MYRHNFFEIFLVTFLHFIPVVTRFPDPWIAPIDFNVAPTWWPLYSGRWLLLRSFLSKYGELEVGALGEPSEALELKASSTGNCKSHFKVSGLPAPTALNPLTELLTAVEQVRDQLSRSNPMAVHLLRNLGENFYGLVVDSDPDLLPQDAARGTNPHAPGVSQVTFDAIDIIGRLLLDARGMLMYRKNCPVTLCGAPVALQHHSEGPFQAIVPAANEPLRLTPFNLALADFFGATNVVQQSWTEKDFEPIRRLLMEYVLRENGDLQDLGAEIAQPDEMPMRAGRPEAPRTARVQSGRRRAQSAPPNLIDEASAVQVVQPIADARVFSHTASVDAAQGSSGRSAAGATPPTESACGTSTKGQQSSEGSETLTPKASTPVAQLGSSDVGESSETAETAGLPVDDGQTGSISDSDGVPASSARPASPKDLRMTMENLEEDEADLPKMDESTDPISSPVGGAAIDPEKDTRRSEDDPIDDEGSLTGVVPASDQEMPMEVEQEDRNLVNGPQVLNSVSDTKIQNGGTGGTGPIDADLAPADIEPAADDESPMEIDQNDQNRAIAPTVSIAVTDTVPQNGSGTSSSSSSGQKPSNVVDIQEIPIATRGLPVRGRPVSGSPTSLLPALPMPGSLPVADQAPTPIADPVRENRKRRCSTSDDHSTLHRPARALTRSLPPIVLSASPNANEDSVGTAEEGTSQGLTERRKQRTPRRYTPGPPPASEQDSAVQNNTRKPGRPRKHRPSPASGPSRAGQVFRSRSSLVRRSDPRPTYQKITKDREARFQKKKLNFLATQGADHQPGSEIHGRKVAEAGMHCSESEVYNHPKLQQIMPHIHTLLFNVNSTGPLPQVKTVKEVKAEELFLEWNFEVNGEDDKLEWKELIRKKDPAYEEWWGLAVKVDKEQLEQMELGWITGTAKDFGIGEEEEVAGPSGRDYREFSPEL